MKRLKDGIKRNWIQIRPWTRMGLKGIKYDKNETKTDSIWLKQIDDEDYIVYKRDWDWI